MVIEQGATSHPAVDPSMLAADWYRALELRERIEGCSPLKNATTPVPIDWERAERRLQRWRAQPPFVDDSLFAQRLASDNIGEDELLSFLGEPAEALRDRTSRPPAWLVEVAAFSSQSPASFDHPAMEPLLPVVAPIIEWARERLRREALELVADSVALPFDPETVADLFVPALQQLLVGRVTRTMVLELHVARLQGQLEGDTPEERFTSFVRRLRQPDHMQALLREYPVLARQLVTAVDRWVTAKLEFLGRLAADWDGIRDMFSPDGDPGVLTGVDGAGDTHRGGRCVLIAQFRSGLRIVYKPRALALDVHFQQLLTWINRRGGHPPFRTLRILDRDTHGWVEFIAAAPCDSIDEVHRFYLRQGGYLALLYALEATDFHHENLTAAGEHPLLLDLEALFHPRLPFAGVGDTEQRAHEILASSVLRVGLLPQRVWSNAQSSGVDLSGLGAKAGQLTPFGVPSWEATGTDAMRLVRQQVELPGSQNRPTLDGGQIDPLDYADDIAAGFTTMYRFLLERRDELLADGGPLAPFLDDEVRVVVRATQTYATLLQESFHPDVLRDALDRTRLFDRLWAPVVHLPYLAQVIPAEQHDLRQGDIPLFATRPGCRDLFTASNERIPDFFEQSRIELVHRRLTDLSEADLQTQLWMIRASLAILAPADPGALRGIRPRRTSSDVRRTLTPERVLSASRAIADQVEELALRGESGISWIGLTMASDLQWALSPVDPGLYDGLAGIALFLAYLGDITGERRHRAMAQEVVQTLRRQMERNRSLMTSIGAFNGWGGILYTLTHLASLWNEPALLDDALTILDDLPPLIEQDERLDVIGGAAGCLAALLALHRHTGSPRALDLAVQCGDRLIARAQPAQGGLAWVVPFMGPRPLTGFSHGAAGIAWALLQLAAATDEDRFRQAALAAIAYERSVFSPAAGNWPDLRELPERHGAAGNGGDSYMTVWCHGAVGIGLARLHTLPMLDDAAVRQEIDTSLKTTCAGGFGGNHSLCHGDLGNLELLLQAGRLLGDPRWQREAEHRMAEILGSIERNGWLCGNRLEVESPGLMTGLAGIGYGLLRYSDPHRVPSVLLLEPPIRRQQGEPTR